MSETVTVECDNCGREFEFETGEERGPAPDVCESCAFAAGMAKMEAPEGGYRRGSDLDRL